MIAVAILVLVAAFLAVMGFMVHDHDRHTASLIDLYEQRTVTLLERYDGRLDALHKDYVTDMRNVRANCDRQNEAFLRVIDRLEDKLLASVMLSPVQANIEQRRAREGQQATGEVQRRTTLRDLHGERMTDDNGDNIVPVGAGVSA